MMKYTALYPTDPMCQTVRVFRGPIADGIEVGAYPIDRSRFSPLFHPFLARDGREYALCKRTRARLSVISLPSCAPVCDDEGTSALRAAEVFTRDGGRCRDESSSALVSGHTARDSAVVEWLDLSTVPEGRLERTARLGRVRLARGLTLEQSVRGAESVAERSQLKDLELCVARTVDERLDLTVHAGLLAEEVTVALGVSPPEHARATVRDLLSELMESVARGDPHGERLELLRDLKRAARDPSA